MPLSSGKPELTNGLRRSFQVGTKVGFEVGGEITHVQVATRAQAIEHLDQALDQILTERASLKPLDFHVIILHTRGGWMDVRGLFWTKEEAKAMCPPSTYEMKYEVKAAPYKPNSRNIWCSDD